jgi:hypothetical protein
MQAHEFTVYAEHGIAGGQAERATPSCECVSQRNGRRGGPNLFLIRFSTTSMWEPSEVCVANRARTPRDKRESATAGATGNGESPGFSDGPTVEAQRINHGFPCME